MIIVIFWAYFRFFYYSSTYLKLLHVSCKTIQTKLETPTLSTPLSPSIKWTDRFFYARFLPLASPKFSLGFQFFDLNVRDVNKGEWR